MHRLIDLLTFCSCCGAYWIHRSGWKELRLVHYLQAAGRRVGKEEDGQRPK